MSNRNQGLSQILSAAKAGISTRSARRIERSPPSAPIKRKGRTRLDPLIGVWASVLLPLLGQEPTLTGLTLWEYLDDNYPGQYPRTLLRTLQRRVQSFKACEGADKPVIFRQAVPAGLMGLSDFTHPNGDITIAGKPFDHMIYQFRLAYSGWRYALLIQGGESYAALAEGLQNALQAMGGCPIEHRTDSLCAAFNNHYQEQKLTQSYQAFCDHYGLKATRNNKGVSHENGAIETAHRSLKHRIQQAILLRGSNDFKSVAEYQNLINQHIKRLNAYTHTAFAEEKKHLQPLPKHRFIDYTALSVKVTTHSTIEVRRVTYSVPSRLIGAILSIHLHHDRVIGYIAQEQVIDLGRIYPKKGQSRTRHIDYHHVINALAAKPQAFRHAIYRDELFPDDNYQTLWKIADQQLDAQQACKWIVGVLKIAAQQSTPAAVYDFGLYLLTPFKASPEASLPALKQLQQAYLPKSEIPNIKVQQHPLSSYDVFIHTTLTADIAGATSCYH
jgi:hypothetical protein